MIAKSKKNASITNQPILKDKKTATNRSKKASFINRVKKASSTLYIKKFLQKLQKKTQPNRTIRILSLEIKNWKSHLARTIVFVYAIIAGLAVSLLTYTTTFARKLFHEIKEMQADSFLGEGFLFVWMPAITLFTIWLVRSYAPATIGSGIPQVIAAGHPSFEKHHYHRLVSLRISIVKIIGTTLAAFSGLSVGRQGPSVQIAAGIILEAKRWFEKISPRRWFHKNEINISHDSLLIAGGASGLAAAFNTPLAGIIFAMEEMSQKLGGKNSPMITMSIAFSGLVAIMIFGNKPYFDLGDQVFHTMNVKFFFVAILISLIGGVSGGIFSILLISRFPGWGSAFMRWFKKHPYIAGLFCSLLAAYLGYISNGKTLIDDYIFTRSIIDGNEIIDYRYLIFKYMSIWFSNISGVPGGIFSPSITLGAGMGNYIADLFQVVETKPMIAVGMVTFLAAVTQAPLTAFFIVNELLNGHSLILILMSSAIISSYIARLFAPPFYSTLAKYYINRFKSIDS